MMRQSCQTQENQEMKKSEADKIFDELLRESWKKSEKIMEEAKANGTWKMGLDSNKDLFKEEEKRLKDEIKKLASMVDDWDN